MLCEDCGAKLIKINTSYGMLVYCPKCCTGEVELAFMSRGKAVKRMKK